MENQATCNQCGEQLYRYKNLRIEYYFCINPACPNYALIQIPLEDMPMKIK